MATSPLVPGRLPVAIEDHPYQIEPSGFRRETVQVLRQQADVSSEPGEASLNPQGLWRRSQESWHHGAGQDFLDGKTEEAADPHRFRASKGADVWTRGQVSLLNSTVKTWASANTNLEVITTGSIILLADGTEVYTASYPVNLTPYASLGFEAGTTGSWTAGAGTTIAASTTWAAYFSTYSLAITSNGSTTPSATTPTGTSGIAVTAGRNYRFGAVINRDAAAVARFWTFSVTWYNAAGATISTSSEATTVNDNVVTEISTVDFTAPALAAYASLGLRVDSTIATGETHYADVVVFQPTETIQYSTATTWRSLSINVGEAAQTVQSIATNGTYVWAALGTSGLHRSGSLGGTITAAVINVPAAPASGQISLVGYANGFLLAAGSAGVSASRQNTLWLVNDPLGTPTLGITPTFAPIKTHDNPSFVWTGIASGRSCVYAWGNSGNNGEVYKIVFDPNTGTLATAASPATFLPDGEGIHALYFYAGGIILGTSKGVRLGQADGAGNIDYGPLIDTDRPVYCLEPQGRFCWFGLTKYDATSGGLGRVDLGFFTDALTPAWASDLMATTQADVTTVATWSERYLSTWVPDRRLFTVSGVGLFVEEVGARVASGALDTGTFRFSTSEPKTARSLDVRHHALAAGGSVAADLQRDASGTWTSVGSSSTAASNGPATPLDLQSLAAEAMELRFTLARATDIDDGPELTRWTAKVLPTPSTIDETFTIPIILAREVEDSNGANYPMDIDAEVTYLKGLERARTLVNLQLGDESHTVYLAASEFQGKQWGPGRKFMEGILNTIWQTVRG